MPPSSPFTGVRRKILMEWGKALFMAWLASQNRSRTMRQATAGPIPVPVTPPAPIPRRGGGFAATVQKLILAAAITIGVTMAVTSGDVLGWVAARQVAPAPVISASIAHIDSRQGWQSSGLTVREGDRITADVTSGGWTTQRGTALTGPGGTGVACATQRPATQCTEPMPNVASGSLIARIGDTLVAPAAPGVFIAPTSGPMQLRINDADAGLADNEGVLSLRLSVVP